MKGIYYLHPFSPKHLFYIHRPNAALDPKGLLCFLSLTDLG